MGRGKEGGCKDAVNITAVVHDDHMSLGEVQLGLVLDTERDRPQVNEALGRAMNDSPGIRGLDSEQYQQCDWKGRHEQDDPCIHPVHDTSTGSQQAMTSRPQS